MKVDERLLAAEKTVDVLKRKVKQLYNSEHQSAIHQALDRARKRMEENLRKQQLIEARNEELRKHNEALESKVQERTRAIRLLLDNVGQGFFTVDARGLVGKEYSSAVATFFGVEPGEKPLSELLRRKNGEIEESLRILFEERIDFEDCVEMLPQSIELSGRIIDLSYRPIRGANSRIELLMVISTDVTELRELEKKSELDRLTNRMIIKILRSRNDFIELMDIVNGLRSKDVPEQEARRTLHTLKGSFGFLDCRHIQEICHGWEETLASGYSEYLYERAIDEIRGAVDQLVAEHEQVLNLKTDKFQTIGVQPHALEELLSKAIELRAPEPLREAIERLGEVPAEAALKWLNEAFISTAQRLNKAADPIEWLPSDPIRPDLYRELFKSLIHLIQNAADHGIEPHDERVQISKRPAGRMTAQLLLKGDEYHLTFRDDGRGLDYDKIRERAKQKGLPVPETEQDCQELLLRGDFSTKDYVTETSGRGIGLEAVHKRARELGGAVHLRSKPGKGTEVTVLFKRKRGSVLSASRRTQLENSVLRLIDNERLLKIIIKGIAETLNGHTNTRSTPLKPFLRIVQNRDEITIAGILHLKGKGFSTTLLLGFPRESFLKIYRNMFEQPATDISAENRDLAGELLNIAFGVMDPELRTEGYEFSPSLPMVLTGEALAEKLKTVHSEALVVPFSTGSNQFVLEIMAASEWEND